MVLVVNGGRFWRRLPDFWVGRLWAVRFWSGAPFGQGFQGPEAAFSAKSGGFMVAFIPSPPKYPNSRPLKVP